MTELKQLTDSMWVAGQLSTTDIDAIADAGITHIICNRPDGEAEDQAAFADIEAAATAKGLTLTYLPVANPRAITLELVAAFSEAVETNDVTLAYCRTGTRSAWIWAYSQLNDLPAQEIVEIGAKNNYNLSALLG